MLNLLPIKISGKFNFLLLILIFFSFTQIKSQIVYEDLNNPVYAFLEKLTVKKLIDLNLSVKPYSKKEIVNKLKVLKEGISKLNKVEREELDWYLKRYGLENNKKVKILGEFDFLSSKFKFRAYPLAGYEISTTGSYNGYSKWIGARFEGSTGNISMMFEYIDTGEFGDNVDVQKNLTPETGHFIKYAPNGIEFSDVKGSIIYDFGIGSIALKKNYVNWGSGKFGKLFLSSNAASFPHIEFKLQPASWFSLSYIHGWLNSLVLDSSRFYYSYQGNIQPFLVETYINKYIAANIISFKPYKWLTFSVGNSFIYSGDLRPEMFIPVMYFKVMDHNTGRGDVNDGNGLIFFDFNTNYFKNINIYGSLLIDVLEIRSLLKGEFYKSWFGVTAGVSFVDVIIPNLDIFAEYSRLNPWLYENKYITTNYKHLGYVLGHWIGNNADLLSFQLNYKFIRSLNLSLKSEIFRKGGSEDIYYAYIERKKLPFLFGNNRYDFSIEFSALFNPLHNVYVKGKYKYSEITDEETQRTPAFLLGNKSSFILSVSYGFP